MQPPWSFLAHQPRQFTFHHYRQPPLLHLLYNVQPPQHHTPLNHHEQAARSLNLQQLNHHHRACSNNNVQNTINALPWKQRERTITPKQLQQRNSSRNAKTQHHHHHFPCNANASSTFAHRTIFATTMAAAETYPPLQHIHKYNGDANWNYFYQKSKT